MANCPLCLAQDPPMYIVHVPAWLPATGNKILRSHWSVESRSKSTGVTAMMLAAKTARVPAARGPRRAAALLTGWRHGKMPDADAFDKCLLDVLVRAGLLVDDSPRFLVGRLAVWTRRGRDATTIALWDVEPRVAAQAALAPDWLVEAADNADCQEQ